MVLALSLQTDIKSIGAYAGFAAIVGLALLVILYFAQAREMRRLSDQLEEQEERLRRVPPPAPMTVARPVAMPAPAAVARPAGPLLAPSTPAAAPATATVAIPGARRVPVVAAGVPAGEALTTVTGAGDPVPDSSAETLAAIAGDAGDAAAVETAFAAKEQPSVPGVEAPAPGSPLAPGGEPAPGSPPAAQPSVRPPALGRSPVLGTPPGVVAPATAAGAMASAAEASAEAVAAVPGARRISLAELGGEGDPPDPRDTTVVAKPPAAMPLSARAAASAEPVGVAQASGGEEAQDGEGPSTAEAAVVAVAPPPEQDDSPAAVAPAWEQPERSEEPPGQRRQRGDRGAPREESSVLAPATAAGSRPRYPPSPPVEAGRADPVGVTSRVSAAVPAAGGGGATLRRERRAGADEGGDGAGHSGSHSTLRLAVIAVVLVGVIVLVASQLLSGGSSTPPGSTTTSTNSASNPPPSSVTVAVLNGTTESGLAGRVSSTLTSEGYRRGTVANAPTQNRTSTVIEYTNGNRNAAIEVAIALALTPAQVVPAGGATLAAATQAGAAPTAVVVLGSNYAQR